MIGAPRPPRSLFTVGVATAVRRCCSPPALRRTTRPTLRPDGSGDGRRLGRLRRRGLPLFKPGRLTVGTDDPAYPPWFAGDDPTNGKGYEGAVA